MRSASLLRTVWDQAIADKVRHGRLRDAGWPHGLRAVVAVGTVLFGLTGLLALLAGPIRRGSVLNIPNSLGTSQPAAVIWVLVFLVMFCLAMFVTAAAHGPWWLTTLGLLMAVSVLSLWAAMSFFVAGLGLSGLLGVLALGGLVVLVFVRRRRGLAWWEFPLVLGVCGLAVVPSVYELTKGERVFGYRFVPMFLEESSVFLTYLVLPAAFAAGAAVAEIAVGVTVVATRVAQGRPGRHWPYVVLAVVVALRLAQESRRLVELDLPSAAWLGVVPAVVLIGVFAAVAWLLHRLTPVDRVEVAELPDQLSKIGIGVGAAIIGTQLPVMVLLVGLQLIWLLVPSTSVAGFDPSPWVDRLTDVFRIVLGLVLVGMGLWRARRGQSGLALVLACVGVVLVGLGMRLMTGYRLAVWLDVDSLILVTTLLVLVVLGWLLVRRTLSADRALGLVGVLVLVGVLAARSVVDDPVAAVFGYTGVGFVLFGLVWDYLTGSQWANVDGPRVRQPVRVLIAVAYPLLTVTILASDALNRLPNPSADLTTYAEFGDLVLGTGLVAAAAIVLLSAVRADRPVV